MNRHELPFSMLSAAHAAHLGQGLPLILPAEPVSTIGGEPCRVIQRVTDDTVVIWTKPLDTLAG